MTDLCSNLCSRHGYGQLVALLVYCLLEYALGRRETGPGSVLEALLLCGYSLLKRFPGREKQ